MNLIGHLKSPWALLKHGAQGHSPTCHALCLPLAVTVIVGRGGIILPTPLDQRAPIQLSFSALLEGYSVPPKGGRVPAVLCCFAFAV